MMVPGGWGTGKRREDQRAQLLVIKQAHSGNLLCLVVAIKKNKNSMPILVHKTEQEAMTPCKLQWVHAVLSLLLDQAVQ